MQNQLQSRILGTVMVESDYLSENTRANGHIAEMYARMLGEDKQADEKGVPEAKSARAPIREKGPHCASRCIFATPKDSNVVTNFKGEGLRDSRRAG